MPSPRPQRRRPRAGSTCSPPTPTRAARSTASCSAGRSSEPNEEFGGYFNFSKDGSAGRRRHAQRRHGRHARRVDRLPGGRRRRGRPSRGRSRPRRQRDRAGHGGRRRSAHGRRRRPRRRGHRHVAAGDCTTASAIVGEPGAPGWFELHTRDYERLARSSTAPCSAGTPTRDERHPRVPLHDPRRGRRSTGRRDGRLRLPGRGRAAAGRSTSHGRCRRQRGPGRRARRHRDRRAGGHALRPPATLADPTGAVFKLQQPPTG